MASMMDSKLKPPTNCTGDAFVTPGSRDMPVQFVLSAMLGLSAFVGFCILRPRWRTLYAARTSRPNFSLPALPDTFLGWVPVLYRVTEDEVLASAGLDAFVFLRFFKMAIRLFVVMWFFATAVLWPINYYFVDRQVKDDHFAVSRSAFETLIHPEIPQTLMSPHVLGHDDHGDDDTTWNPDMGYLWAYLVFTYFFTALIIYYMNWETFRVIRVRQDYLGTQSTVTDRTFRLSGLPHNLRDETAIRELVEKLGIGRVESVTLCRDWAKLDQMMEQRNVFLRRLEAAWADYVGPQPLSKGSSPRGLATPRSGYTSNGDADGESDRLLLGNGDDHFDARPRPQVRIRYGFLGHLSRFTDAIDYWEEKLRRLDDDITHARQADYEPGTMAFVTMDSIAACQMAIQARIDPRPGQLLAKPAPAPPDVVWRNTYSARGIRRIKSWTVTLFVTILTLVWLIPVVALAGLLSFCTIQKLFPNVAEWLSDRDVIKALVQTGLPTLTVSLLNIAVPFLYDYLSNRQGLISQGDVELAVISKNFFFTFFNIFVVFAVSNTATEFWASLRDLTRDTRMIPQTIATYIQKLGVFYANFILLQGVGLMPFRLLQIGPVSMYPIYRMFSKTPRDFAELQRPNTFQYGFYLPTALLVFILCMVYSVLRQGFLILVFGLVYFTFGYFIYKYQLLYAMDQPQHATGGAWPIICYRIILGLLVFQIAMSGVLALQSAFVVSILVLPLLVFTVWYSYYFRQRFEPLTRFIALRSIRASEGGTGDINGNSEAVSAERFGPQRFVAVFDDGEDGETDEIPRLQRGQDPLRRGSTVDEDKEKGLRFVNPSLTAPLEQPWIYRDPPPAVQPSEGDAQSLLIGPEEPESSTHRVPSSQSSFSLGDTHVWRDLGGEDA
jgi:hypothetical protein